MNRKNATILRFLGFTLIFGWAGNCMQKCLHFQRSRHKDGRRAYSLTARWKRASSETWFIFHVGGGRLPKFSWESKLLARRFGEMEEAPHGDIWIWRSKIFGTHMDI